MVAPALTYRPDIDGLRAVAVLSIVVFHAGPSILPGGFLGVDIFFVISGYLISLILLREQANGSFRFAAFYARRVRRLFPALLVVLVATLLAGAFALFADEYERLGQHAVYAIMFLHNFRLMDEAGYFDLASHAKPLLHLWSLSVEEQFYLAWPVTLVAVSRFRLHPAIVLAVVGMFSYGLAIHLVGRNPDAVYFNPLARAWELLMGAALAHWHHSNGAGALPGPVNSRAARDLLSLAGFALVFWALFSFDNTTAHPSPLVFAPLAGVVLIIASGAGALANRLLAMRPLVLVGLISYPLYLWHWPLISLTHIAESGSPPAWLVWIAAGLSIPLAWATYILVERPVRSSRRQSRAVAGLAGLMGLLLMAACIVVVADGLPDRRPVRYAKEAEAQMVREPATDEDCLGRFAQGEAPFYCRQTDNGGPLVGIIGDSHAHVLFTGVAELAAANGYGALLLGNSGCPPFDGAVTGRNAQERNECARKVETILGEIEREPRIAVVVVASRGPRYLTGAGYGPAEPPDDFPPIAAREADHSPVIRSPDDVFGAGLEATMTRLRDRGITGAYLLQLPELGVPARNCLKRPLEITGRGQGCEVPYVEYKERMSNYRSLIEGLRVYGEKIRMIDPEPVFCTTDHCSGFADGRLLYADDDHLSVAGSRQLAPLILRHLGVGSEAGYN